MQFIGGRQTDIAKNIDFMMGMVKDYLPGKTPRFIFELDFKTEILERYRKMERENEDYAQCFYDLLSEEGVNAGDDLSDAEFKQLIRVKVSKGVFR